MSTTTIVTSLRLENPLESSLTLWLFNRAVIYRFDTKVYFGLFINDVTQIYHPSMCDIIYRQSPIFSHSNFLPMDVVQMFYSSVKIREQINLSPSETLPFYLVFA